MSSLAHGPCGSAQAVAKDGRWLGPSPKDSGYACAECTVRGRTAGRPRTALAVVKPMAISLSAWTLVIHATVEDIGDSDISSHFRPVMPMR